MRPAGTILTPGATECISGGAAFGSVLRLSEPLLPGVRVCDPQGRFLYRTQGWIPEHPGWSGLLRLSEPRAGAHFRIDVYRLHSRIIDVYSE